MLREALSDDAPAIAALHVASWRDAYAHILDPAFLAGPVEEDRMRCWTGRFADPRPDQHVVLALDGEQPAGFVCVFAEQDPVWGALVDNLHVLPGLRGRGIGAQLLGRAAEWVDTVRPGSPLHLWVFEANRPAMQFYERMGAQPGERVASGMTGAEGHYVIRLTWPAAQSVGRAGQAIVQPRAEP